MKESSLLKEGLKKWSQGLGTYFDLFSNIRKDNSINATKPKQRFQHKLIFCDTHNPALKRALEEEEKEGWELCGILNLTSCCRLFFKKPV